MEKQAAPPREKEVLPCPAKIDKTHMAGWGKADFRFRFQAPFHNAHKFCRGGGKRRRSNIILPCLLFVIILFAEGPFKDYWKQFFHNEGSTDPSKRIDLLHLMSNLLSRKIDSRSMIFLVQNPFMPPMQFMTACAWLKASHFTRSCQLCWKVELSKIANSNNFALCTIQVTTKLRWGA